MNVWRAVHVFGLERLSKKEVPLYESPVPAVVVATQLGSPLTRARVKPLVPADVVESCPVPLPRRMEFDCIFVQPVPPFGTVSAEARVRTPALLNDDVAVPPNQAWFEERRVDEALPFILTLPPNRELPTTSKIFPVVDVALLPKTIILVVSVG